MKIDGHNCKISKTIGYRYSNPAKDFDIDGNPVESNYVSFVKIKDCSITTDLQGNRYYHPEDAPSIPVGHGGTYYGYGRWTTRKSQMGVWIGERLCHEYMQCTVYFVRRGKVYTASIKKEINEDQLKREKAGLERRTKAMYNAGLLKEDINYNKAE